MPATEKDLAQDAPWKKIQQNTFTRWCNEHLKCVHKQLNDLHTDLSDGLRFIALLEVLSQKKMPRKHNARPVIRQMQLENVSVGLEFLEREHIRLVSIDSQAIVDGNLKLILGLVWTLILHYSISVPEWEDEEDTSKKQTPKQRLFGWIQNKLPDIPVRNFSKDWQNGRTLGALVDSCAPGLCPDWETWSEEKPVDNAREAMQQADDWLGVPQVITPEEIVDPNVDEYSVMTYLSQFPKAKLKPGAPLRPKLNPKKARAYGPGVEPSGNVATQPTAFVVETVRAGQGDISVSVKGPTGEDDEVKVTANNDKNHTYAVEYTPKAVGPHEVMVLFANQHVSKSPFHVMVSEPQGDANKVSVAGPGLVSAGVVAGRPTDFNINTTGAGVGDVAVVVKGPKDQPTLVDAALEERGPGMYRCCYKPTMEGPHTVAVSFGGLPIPHSPYTVNVAPASKAIACRATGRGLQAKGVRINEIADFTVLTEGAGSGDLQVTLKKPSGVEEPIKEKTVRDTLHACEYKPTAVGKHTVSVTWAGQHTPGSPFTVDVGPEAGKQKVRAWGPGLSSGMVGKSSDFVVEAVGTDVGALGFSIEGPSQCTIDCTDVGDGSCDVKYWPTEPGCYGVHVICDDDEIKNSPFIAEIVPVNTAFHPEKVRISGKGVEPTGNVVGQPLEFTVDAKDAGKAPLQAFAQDVDGTPVPVKVVDNGDGTYACRYTPQKPIKHTVVVTWGALNVPSSPFRVKVGKGSYPQRVKVSGQGVERTGVKAHEPTSFTVDCSEAGEGDVSVGIKCASGVLGPCEADIDFDIIKNDDDTFLVKYTPLAAGRYTIMVLFADEELPNSPYRIKVDPSHDVHKVKAEGPGVSKTGVQLNQPTQFTVTTKDAGQAKLDVQFTGSTKGNPVRNMSIKDNKDDTHTVAYTPIQQGPMAVAVTYGGDLVPYSPFTVDIAPPVDLGKIQVQGLENKLVVGEEFEFDVNTRGAGGRGKLDVHVVSPSNKPLDCSVESAHTGNGSTVRFLPKEEGPHRVSMVYDGQLLDDTFTLEAALPPDPKKVRVSGEGLRSGKVGHPAQFSIDTRQAGQGNLSLTVEGPSEAKLECVDNGDGTCSVSYLPVEAGDYLINILFAGIHVPGSPFQATIEPSFDPKKVLVKGEGLKNAKVGDTGSFTLDCSQAGDANLDVKMVSDSGVEADVVTRRQSEGVYAVNYTPVCHGPHTMNVKYGGQSVPTFPARLEVQPSVDTSGIKVFGPGIEKAFCDATTDFSVDASSLTRTGGDDLTASITGPSGVVIDAAVTDKKNGTYVVEYVPFELGKHLVDVMYKEVPVAGSPFPVVVSEGCDPKRVCVSGPGLKSGWTNQTNSFTVETRGAGTGGLGLLIEGPTEAVISCTDNKNGTCLVEYVPQDPGQYEVLVSYGGQSVPGSPFVVPVQDKVNPSKVKVSGTGVEPGVRAGIPQEFVVDASRAGQAPLKVELINPRGKAEPVQVKDLGGGLHQVNYVAREDGPHGVRILYAGEVVSHSADKLKVLPSCDASKVRANGPGLASAGIAASLPVEFFIDTQDAGQENISVIVTDPDGKPRPTKLVSNGDGTYTVSYLPDRAGCYTVEVKYGDDDIPCSPYTVNAIPTGNAKKCKVHGLGSYMPIGHKTTISVNAQGAGAGKVTCCVCTPDGREVDLDVLENADGTFDIVYAAPLPGAYTVDIRYGGELVPHSPFHVEALAQVIQEDSPVQECVQEVHHAQPSLAAPQPGDLRPFNLVVPFVVRRGEITGEVRMPSGQKDKPSIVTNQDGTVSVQYVPVEKGLHEMDIKCDREHIPGSPLQFYVDEVGSGNVTAYGPGLSHGVVNKLACFTIDTKDATEGGLSLAVEGPSEAEILCEDHKDGTCTVSYLPTAPGLYKILVKFDDEHIPGSPFLARIADDGRRRTRLSVGSTQDVPLQLRETDLSLLEASIKGPSGGKVPCQLKRLSNGHVGISFTPCEVGDHEVSVLKDGSHVSNSPFIVSVGESEIGDATKVRVSGSGLHEGRTGEQSNFLVDTTQAGYGGLSLAIEGPSKADLDCEEIENGTCCVTYCPMEPGNYLLNIKFADVHVAGSPFTVKVTGEGRLQRQSITRRSQTPSVTSVGSLCDLSLKIPVMDASELKADVVTPSEKTIPAEVVQGVSDGTFCIRFVPEEMGVHTVSVKHHGTHVQGSPFQFTVGPLGEGGAHKVRAAGSGLERAEAGVPAEFTIWSREAGAGGLSIAVEGPHKADISFDDHQDGSCTVSYIVQEAGEYEVSIRFNDEHIPDSPFMVPVTATSDAARLPTVTRLQGTGLKANHPASFSIDLNGAHGQLDAKVHAPSGTVTDCRISEVEKDKYAIRFLPHENGLHNVHVKLDGSHIPGSPFKLRVGEPGLAADPGLVSAFGSGLNTGVTGCPAEFEVKTARGSGVGPLSITIDGPSKVQMDCKDTAEGYHVTYTPMAPGIYLIAVKYGGPYHIPGSPFKAKITGPRLAGGPGLQESSSFVVESKPRSIMECGYGVDPQFSSDASKVVSRGQGLDHATLSQSNVFQVDCSKAGSNLLLVGMRGPTRPCDEVVAKHVGNNNYTVSYTVSERGDYILVVKWGEDHIPGSPFHVVVV